MPQKNSVKICTSEKKRTAPERLSGRRQKKANPPLKVPTVMTISVSAKSQPIKEATETQNSATNKPGPKCSPKTRGRKKLIVSKYFKSKSPANEIGVPDNQKHVDANTKIALTNEVARSQLLKEPIEERPDSLPPPKKRGRKKKIILAANNTENVTQTTSNVKKNAKKTTPVIKKNLTRKRAADTTTQKPIIKRRKLKEEQVTVDVAENNGTQANKSNENDKHTKEKNKDTNVFSPPEVALRPRRRLTRGKQDSRPTTPCIQPKSQPAKSATTLLIKSPKKRADSPKNLPPEGTRLASPTKYIKKEIISLDMACAGQVESRKTSTSSNSNLSWTRDISSSSTTTCVTVTSNDFVRFNKKMPLIKLTNIHNEVNKYMSPTPVAEDDDSNDDSSTSESGTESSEQQTSNRSDISLDSPSNAKSLNLSSTSLNSVTEIVRNNRDYSEDAMNLQNALINLDVEYKNWLPKGITATDLNSIKDKLLELLCSEFRALVDCRKLQNITTPEIVEGAVCETEVRESNVESLHKSEKSNPVKPNTIVNEKDNTTECLEVGSKEKNTIDKNKNSIIESNKNNVKQYQNFIVKKNVEIRQTVNCHKENNKESEDECNNSYSMFQNICQTDNNKSIEHNNVASNKNYKFKNIRIEVNSAGSKKIELNKSVENTRLESSERVASETTALDENKSDEEDTLPCTSAPVANNQNLDNLTPRSPEPDDGNSSKVIDFTADVDVNGFPSSPYDDDDALSLFAESITGIESSKINASTASENAEKQFEEYVPKPIQNNFISPKSYTYCPTKILEQNKNGVTKTVCEKQNADSTSLCKDVAADIATPSTSNHPNEPNTEELDDSFTKDLLPEENTPSDVNKFKLLSDLYPIKPKDANVIFKGYCFYNLIKKCFQTYMPCRYSHAIPSDIEITNALIRLTNETFIREYVLVRRYHSLLRMYGMCFVSECVRRQLTRMLVEIAHDFITSVKGHINESLIVAVVEITLVYLNNVDLSECEDLLKLNHNDSLLCELFMEIMTKTQNFSQFRSVFLSLTYFMVNNDRMFHLNVAEQILERVCILPFDEPVVKALIQILRLTSPEIFENKNIALFEKQISVNNDVFQEYLSVKTRVHIENLVQRAMGRPVQLPDKMSMSPVAKAVYDSVDPSLTPGPPPLFLSLVEPPFSMRPEMRDGVSIPLSPDTTHLDLVNKTPEDTALPKITRTIWRHNNTPNPRMPITNPRMTIIRPVTNSGDMVHHNNWRNRSIFGQFNRGRFMSPRRLMRPPIRSRPPTRLIKKQHFHDRVVTFGGGPIMYPPPPPDY